MMTNFPPLLLALPLVWIKDRLFLILSMAITRLHSGTSIPSEQASVVTRTWGCSNEARGGTKAHAARRDENYSLRCFCKKKKIMNGEKNGGDHDTCSRDVLRAQIATDFPYRLHTYTRTYVKHYDRAITILQNDRANTQAGFSTKPTPTQTYYSIIQQNPTTVHIVLFIEHYTRDTTAKNKKASSTHLELSNAEQVYALVHSIFLCFMVVLPHTTPGGIELPRPEAAGSVVESAFLLQFVRGIVTISVTSEEARISRIRATDNKPGYEKKKKKENRKASKRPRHRSGGCHGQRRPGDV